MADPAAPAEDTPQEDDRTRLLVSNERGEFWFCRKPDGLYEQIVVPRALADAIRADERRLLSTSGGGEGELPSSVRQVLLMMEGPLRYALTKRPDSAIRTMQTTYAGICSLLGRDPRHVLPHWPESEPEATTEDQRSTPPDGVSNPPAVGITDLAGVEWGRTYTLREEV